MKNHHAISTISILAAAAALALAGCGKSDAPAAAAAPARAADGALVVEITANDAMKYSLTEIRAQPGEKIRVSLTNIGRMPKQAMGHNWVLLKPMTDAEIMAFATAAASILPEHLPADLSAVLAHTKMLGGGESDTVTFTAPTEPGSYPFLCTFPGHAALMKGKLIVSPAAP